MVVRAPAPIQKLSYEYRVLSPDTDANVAHVFRVDEQMLEACFNRALQRGMIFAEGQFVARLTLGMSGRVVHLGLDGPPRERRMIEACAREVVSRWVFPQRWERYSAALAIDVHVR
jgi:hypothetical protein